MPMPSPRAARAHGRCCPLALMLCVIGCALERGSAETPPATVRTWEIFETTFTTAKPYSHPFVDVEVDVTFTRGGESWRIPAFFDGGSTWRVRFAPPHAGDYEYSVSSTDVDNADFRGAKRTLHVEPYSGVNPLRRHGFLRVAADRRHFEHRDGTPFFWLGDTWWKCLSKRLSFEDFAALTTDRVAKGFSVVQIVCGPYPDEGHWEERWENEGGKPYLTRDFTAVIPEYFRHADRRIFHLAESGIVPAIVGGWGRGDCDSLALAGVAGMKRHWRNLVARYGALPTVWIVGGESAGPEWTELANYVKSLDAYARPRTMHPHASGRSSVIDESAIDFDMLQTGHGGLDAAHAAIPKVLAAIARTPPMPVLIGEFCYEGHMQQAYDDAQRYAFWGSMLSGAAGLTYGAAGVWHASVEGDPGLNRVYDLTTWREGMELPGSRQLGFGKRLLEAYPWSRFESRPDWAEDGVFAAGIPGEIRVLYQPRRGVYDWGGIVVKGLEPDVSYRAFYFDPIRGRRHEAGAFRRIAFDFPSLAMHANGPLFRDTFERRDARWIDAGSATQCDGGRLIARQGAVTVLDGIAESDLMVSVEANLEAEAGVILRYEDSDHYVVGLYSPLFRSIFLHERRNGEYGPRLGEVKAPELGPRVTLAAVATGDFAALTITDGDHTYTTPPVRLSRRAVGQAGVWMFQIGERQEFSAFTVSRTRLELPAPATTARAIEWVGSDALRVGSLPCPQDWVLVLERCE
jgi:Protein of unknown function (DUF4038)/Domain of unknown function (DUF5060)